jgi:hypothetical protein
LSLAQGEPDWRAMRFEHLADLPAVRWKLDNLGKLKKSNRSKFALQAETLSCLLG